MHERLIRRQLATAKRGPPQVDGDDGGTSGIGGQTLKLVLSEPGNLTRHCWHGPRRGSMSFGPCRGLGSD